MNVVAVLGTGVMGAGIARSLLREGFAVQVWNRTADKARPLAEDGATVAATAAEAVTGAEVVITMLFDAEATVQVLRQAKGLLGEDTVVLQSATVGPTGIRAIAAELEDCGAMLLDCPVLGTKAPAEQGKLVPLVSGPAG